MIDVRELLSKQSTIFIIIGAVVVIVAIILLVTMIEPAPEPAPVVEEEPEPVYELELDDIKFSLVGVEDLGNTLYKEDARYTLKEDLVSTERFIKITIGAQNLGQNETEYGDWDILEVVDEKGSNYPFSKLVKAWMPRDLDSGCGQILKPRFEPTNCFRIYEVAKASEELKIKVYFKSDNQGKMYDFIDLKFEPEKATSTEATSTE